MGFERYLVGKVSDGIAERMVRAVRFAPVISLSNDPGKKGTIAYTPARPDEAEILNQQNIYHANTPELMGLYDEAMLEMSAPLMDALGAPWKILRVRSWETLPGANMGPAKWHFDGLGKEILKIMLYCTKQDHGFITVIDGTAHQIIRGPAGTWVLLASSAMKHHGIAPLEGTRVAVEYTLKIAEVEDAA